jgi:hypothetical protein
MSTEKRNVCGIDVHKAFLVAAVVDREGKGVRREEFSRTPNHVPGRKTGITDSLWIPQLELNGLIKPSRIFAGEMYDLRSLTRIRELLVQNRNELKNKFIIFSTVTAFVCLQYYQTYLGNPEQ